MLNDAVPPPLVMVMPEEKLNVPPEPLRMSTRAPPLNALLALVKLYVPSALSNCRPVPAVAGIAPLKASVPAGWLPGAPPPPAPLPRVVGAGAGALGGPPGPVEVGAGGPRVMVSDRERRVGEPALTVFAPPATVMPPRGEEAPSAWPLRLSPTPFRVVIELLPPVLVMVSVPPPVAMRPAPCEVAPLAETTRSLKVIRPPVLVPLTESTVLPTPKVAKSEMRCRWLKVAVPVMLASAELTSPEVLNEPVSVQPLNSSVPLKVLRLSSTPAAPVLLIVPL